MTKESEKRKLSELEASRLVGGNPILVALGIISSAVGAGRAADAAAGWFMEGWNNPK